MKNKLIILLNLLLIFINGCAFNSEVYLSDFEIRSLYLFEEKLSNYYNKSYNDTLPYTEFYENSIFTYNSKNDNGVFCAMAKTTTFYGEDIITFVYFKNTKSIYFYIDPCNDKEYGDKIAIEYYNNYLNNKKITFINFKLANDKLKDICDFSSIDNTNIIGNEELLADEYRYKTVNNEIHILSYEGNLSRIIQIPSYIEGKKVTRITNFFDFYNEEEIFIEEIILPKYLEYIDEKAFGDYFDINFRDNSLEKVYIDYVFIPDSILYIDNYSFGSSTKLFFEGTNYILNSNLCYSNVKREDILFYENMLFKKSRDGVLGGEAILLDVINSSENVEVPMVVKICDEILNVTEIGYNAFTDCINLNNLSLQGLLKEVKREQFLPENYYTDVQISDYYKFLNFASFGNGYYISSSTNRYYFFVGYVDKNRQVTLHDNTEFIDFYVSFNENSITNEYGIYYVKSENNNYFYSCGFDKDYNFINNNVIYNTSTRIISYNIQPLIEEYNLHIPKDVYFIEQDSLGYSMIIVDSRNEKYKSIDGSLYSEYGLRLQSASRKSLDNNNFIIPNGVMYVSKDALYGVHFNKLIIPDSVIEIDNDIADYGMFWSSFNELQIGENLKIFNNLFSMFPLDNVEISQKNPYISAQKNLITNKNNNHLYGFYGDLPEIYTLPNFIKTTDINAFASISKSTFAIIIPNEIEQIGISRIGYVHDTTKQRNFYIENEEKKYAIDPNFNLDRGEISIIDNTIYVLKNDYAILSLCLSKKTHFEIRDYAFDNVPVKYIDSMAFANTDYVKSISFGKNIGVIGNYAFARSSIENIIIPNTVTTIGDRAFYYASIKTIVIPETVTYVGEYLFTGLLPKVFLESNNIPSSWNNYWSQNGYGDTIEVYTKGTWNYANGIPTPLI